MAKRSASAPPTERVLQKKHKTGNEGTRVVPPDIQSGAPITLPFRLANLASEDNLQKEKSVPIKECFIPWTPSLTPPPFNDAWGRKPYPGPEGPQPDLTSPPARTSNAQTTPPLFEDRKYRYKIGSRYVKYFGPMKPENTESLPDLDQEQLLVLPLIDMRPKSRTDPTPKRQPVYYVYEHGKPKDWSNKQTIKALNDRRTQAILRITLDEPFTPTERQYLASLLRDYPDASIKELTERFNWRFMYDFIKSTAMEWEHPSDGRTIESVRYEYLLYKALYDQGKYPEKVRGRNYKPRVIGETATIEGKRMAKTFGLPDGVVDEESDSGTDAESTAATDTESSASSCDDYEMVELPQTIEDQVANKADSQESYALTALDEELLELACSDYSIV